MSANDNGPGAGFMRLAARYRELASHTADRGKSKALLALADLFEEFGREEHEAAQRTREGYFLVAITASTASDKFACLQIHLEPICGRQHATDLA